MSCGAPTMPPLPARARVCARQLQGRRVEILRAHDVVAIEHRTRLVAGDRHRDALRHPRVHQVAHPGPPDVIAEPAIDTGLAAGGCPPARVVGPVLAVEAFLEVREEVRNTPAELAFEQAHAIDLRDHLALEIRPLLSMAAPPP